MTSTLLRRKVQAVGEIRAADVADEVRVATHDKLIAGTGQADVEAFARAFEPRFVAVIPCRSRLLRADRCPAE